jgi:histidine triad (HIT) family protein
MNECIFCAIVAGIAPATPVGETDRAVAFMNANPAALGHLLVVPRSHAEDIWDLSQEDGAAVWALTQRLAVAVRDALSPEGLTLFQSNRQAGWQTVFHFHIHIVPRWEGDGLEPSWGGPSGNRDGIEHAATVIRANLT